MTDTLITMSNTMNEVDTAKVHDQQPLVSVVVATYRRDKSLAKTLLSIINQSYVNIEIIVIDDNADSFWNKKVSNIISDIERLYMHHIIYAKNSTNLGPAETRNIGIKMASGDYITFLDDDDIYLPDKVKAQIEHMLVNQSDFSITDLYLYNENDNLIERRIRTYIKKYDKKNLLRYHLLYHITGTDALMFKRTYLIGINGFPLIRVGDEFHLMQKAIESGGLFSYLPDCQIKAYIHTDTHGVSSGESKIRGENELFIYKKKYFPVLDARDVRYIQMRHFAVLAFAKLRMRQYFGFFMNAIKSFLSAPISCLRLFIQTKCPLLNFEHRSIGE